jgi:hypothetical protein
MFNLYSTHPIDPRAFDPLEPANIIGNIGCALWVFAYVFMIRKGFKDRAHGLPLVAICLNFSWEFLAAWVFPNPDVLTRTIYRIWFGVDILILWQLLRYGRELQENPLVRRYFHPIVAGTLVLSLVGQCAFVASYQDRLGVVVAFGINLIMSILFIPMLWARREHLRGISSAGAWLKMVGTLLTSIQSVYFVRWLNPELPSLAFFLFLAVSIFLFDCIYLFLLSTVRSTEAAAVGQVVPLTEPGRG